MQHAEQQTFDSDAYLAWEATESEKHEYIAGEVFAIVSARREHVVVSGNLFAALKQKLRGKPCQAYIADMKLHVEPANAFFYPDVMVSCHADNHRADLYLSHPSLIIEVLSDNSEALDQGIKFASYRLLESLQEYVMVDVGARRIEQYRRTEDNDWLLHEIRNDDNCVFKSLGVTLPVGDIFEDIAP